MSKKENSSFESKDSMLEIFGEYKKSEISWIHQLFLNSVSCNSFELDNNTLFKQLRESMQEEKTKNK